MKAFMVPIATSVLIGIAQTVLLLYCWTYIAAFSPVPRWFLDLGLRGVPFRLALGALDFLVNVVLCLPAAFALSRLRPRKLPLYLVAAVAPGFLWQYRVVFRHITIDQGVVQFIPGMLAALLMLPVAALLVTLLTARPGGRRSGPA